MIYSLSNFRKIICSPQIIRYFILFIIGMALLFGLIGDKGYLELIILKQREKKLHLDIEELIKKQKLWEDKIYSLKNNTDYYEAIAREKMGYIGKKEIVYEIQLQE